MGSDFRHVHAVDSG